MKKEHLTPDGWKPCYVTTGLCKYETRSATNGATLVKETALKHGQGDKNALGRFFDSLFGKKASPEEKQTKNVTVPEGKVNELTVDSEGRYHTISEDKSNGKVVHSFGDLIDKETIEALHQADINKAYQLGECGGLAGELWHLNDHVDDYYIYKAPHDDMFGIHQFVKLKDGTYADSLGIWAEEAFLKYWRSIDSKGEITLFVDEDEVDPKKDPKFTPYSAEVFKVVNDMINKHMVKQL